MPAMYSHHLDTPPPQSQFRRPWSPDPYDPLPSLHMGRNNDARNDNYFQDNNQYNNYDYDYSYSPYGQQGRQRQASEASVEALDLADYATTLRSRRDQNYQYHPQDMYPPSPARPLSRDSRNPPSLVSRGDTLSSNTHSNSSRYPSRRPFSLPPQSNSSRSGANSFQASYRTHNYPYLAGEPDYSLPISRQSQQEIDIGHFPAWSRKWYETKDTLNSPPDIYTSLPTSRYDSTKFFDPVNTLKHGYNPQPDFSDPYNSYAGTSSYGHESNRDLLPWSNDPPEYGLSIDSALKEERMRMLEREFGPNANSRIGKDSDFVDEDGKPLVGTVDERGHLVTQGPKKRLATRILQLIFALTAAIPAIYAALFIKPKEVPPPSGTPSAYVLYVLSVITFFGLLFLFVFYPCCCGRRKKTPGASGPMANGMMVLPVQGLSGGRKAKKGKAGKKGKKGKGGAVGMGDVQVNLIVDPHAFGHRDDEETDEEDADWESSVPGAYDGGEGTTRKRRRKPKRRSVFAALAMEEKWKKARAWLKKTTAVDVAGAVVWGAVFIFILLGKNCPIGGFEGWCNAYNTSTAAACLLCIAFAVSTFFDIKDLHSSKASPRTRT